MPHILVKLWPGKSERQKQNLADKITRAVVDTLHYGEESVSVGFEQVPARNWMAESTSPIFGRSQARSSRPRTVGPAHERGPCARAD